jgi:hypothetical protein
MTQERKTSMGGGGDGGEGDDAIGRTCFTTAKIHCVQHT